MKAIICEYHSWNSIYRIGNHHYAREFMSNGWEVLWVSHPVSWLHGLKPGNLQRMKISSSPPFHHPDGPMEFIPRTVLPFLNTAILNSQWVLKNTLNHCSPSIGRVLESSGFMNADLLWITDTSMHGLIDLAQPKTVAVRIADDNTKFRDMPPSLEWAETRLCRKADILFVTSSPLLETRRKKYPNKIHLLRNGVEHSHFRGDFPRPQEYAKIDGPIAIYIGAIEDWFDVGWVEALAKWRKDIFIVLIGRVGKDLSRIRRFRNVKILGPKPYGSIPSYLAHADCGIIPFQRIPLVESVSPIKMMEFFASGLPVVSASWKELENLRSPAFLAHSKDEFVSLIETAIDKNDKGSNRAVYKSYAERNSWKARYVDVMKVLEPFLQQRKLPE